MVLCLRDSGYWLLGCTVVWTLFWNNCHLFSLTNKEMADNPSCCLVIFLVNSRGIGVSVWFSNTTERCIHLSVSKMVIQQNLYRKQGPWTSTFALVLYLLPPRSPPCLHFSTPPTVRRQAILYLHKGRNIMHLASFSYAASRAVQSEFFKSINISVFLASISSVPFYWSSASLKIN
jgi:hypothetical protein